MLSQISGCVYIYDTVSEGMNAITSLGLIFLNPRLAFLDVLKILYTSLVNATILCDDISRVTYFKQENRGSPKKREVGLKYKYKKKKNIKK